MANEDFSKIDDITSVPVMFSKVKKGSKKYREILIGKTEANSAPKMKTEADWKISAKQGRENFFEKAFSFWKYSSLLTKIQLMLLKISNHQIKLNSQLKHYARDENGLRVEPGCTFCTLANEVSIDEESYKHFFLCCPQSKGVLEPIATKYNIPIPNVENKGELILYYWPWKGKWKELRINVFYAIYKNYLLTCRARKILPPSIHSENVLKIECKNIE